MGANCAPLTADLFLFCYEGDFLMSLSGDKQANDIDAFNTTSRYLDGILTIWQVKYTLQSSNLIKLIPITLTKATFLDLHLSISNGIVSTKIYNKLDDFEFEIVNFPFLGGDVPRSTSYGVHIFQLIRYARASSHITSFNTRNKL